MLRDQLLFDSFQPQPKAKNFCCCLMHYMSLRRWDEVSLREQNSWETRHSHCIVFSLLTSVDRKFTLFSLSILRCLGLVESINVRHFTFDALKSVSLNPHFMNTDGHPNRFESNVLGLAFLQFHNNL